MNIIIGQLICACICRVKTPFWLLCCMTAQFLHCGYGSCSFIQHSSYSTAAIAPIQFFMTHTAQYRSFDPPTQNTISPTGSHYSTIMSSVYYTISHRHFSIGTLRYFAKSLVLLLQKTCTRADSGNQALFFPLRKKGDWE